MQVWNKTYLILSQKSVFQKHKAWQTHITHIHICECHLTFLPGWFFCSPLYQPVASAFANRLGQLPVSFGLLWLPCLFWRGQVAKEIAGIRIESRSEIIDLTSTLIHRKRVHLGIYKSTLWSEMLKLALNIIYPPILDLCCDKVVIRFKKVVV